MHFETSIFTNLFHS